MRKKIQLWLDSAIVQQLEEQKGRGFVTVSEFIKLAIELYLTLLRYSRDGYDVEVQITKDGVSKSLCLPTFLNRFGSDIKK